LNESYFECHYIQQRFITVLLSLDFIFFYFLRKEKKEEIIMSSFKKKAKNGQKDNISSLYGSDVSRSSDDHVDLNFLQKVIEPFKMTCFLAQINRICLLLFTMYPFFNILNQEIFSYRTFTLISFLRNFFLKKKDNKFHSNIKSNHKKNEKRYNAVKKSKKNISNKKSSKRKFFNKRIEEQEKNATLGMEIKKATVVVSGLLGSNDLQG